MHKSVLLQETIDSLAQNKRGAVIDATIGAGGHSREILKTIGITGRLLAIDQDEEALKIARNVVKQKNITFVHGNFSDIRKIASENGFESVTGIVADIGVSSMQFDNLERGFSFKGDNELDMRMDQSSDLNAKEIVNTYSREDLEEIIRKYGEEKSAKRIAEAIVKKRGESVIEKTSQLAEVVRGVFPQRGRTRIDPATKTFQAIRIAVNKELLALESALPQMVSLLKPGGRIAIISFHSLEDRIVKNFFRECARDCVCPPESPVCRCDKEQTLKIITRKPIIPTEEEILNNKRARSAKLRVAEKI